MITNVIERRDIEIPTIQQQPVGLASMAAAVVAMALVLLFVGGLGPAAADKIQLITSIVMVGLLIWLLTLVANRGGLAPHMGYLMMLFGFFYWFISPAFFLSLQMEGSVAQRYGMMLRPNSIATACIYVAAYTMFSVISYWLCYSFALRRSIRNETNCVPDKIYLLIIGLFLCGFIPYLVFGGGLENVIQSVMAGRSARPPWKSGSLGDQRSALYYLSRSGMVAAAGLAGTWALLAKESRYRLVLIGTFGVTTLLVFLDGGTRSWAALAAVPTALAWISYSVKNRLTLGKVFAFLLILASIQLAFEFARISRNHGWNLESVKAIDPLKREFDNNFFSELTVAVDLVPQRRGYFHLGDFWAFVSHPVPRFLWENKPVSPVLLYYNDVVFKGLLSGAGNKLPSHIGQFHMSFGAVGVLILGVISGIVSAFASAMIQSRFIGLSHLGAVLATWWFIMSRGVYPGWTYVVIFAWILIAFGFRSSRS
jgi:hypothetical protein